MGVVTRTMNRCLLFGFGCWCRRHRYSLWSLHSPACESCDAVRVLVHLCESTACCVCARLSFSSFCGVFMVCLHFVCSPALLRSAAECLSVQDSMVSFGSFSPVMRLPQRTSVWAQAIKAHIQTIQAMNQKKEPLITSD